MEFINTILMYCNSNARINELNSGEVAIIAACVGGLIATVPQLIMFYLNKSKEQQILINLLISEERRLSYLLAEYYKELVMHKVHKQYWYRTSEIHGGSKEDQKDSHNRHFQSNQRSFEILRKIRETTSEYFKVIYHFMRVTQENALITEYLNNLISFKPRKAIDFANITDYNELLIEREKEEAELNKIYEFYSSTFSLIRNEMKKQI